MHFRSPRLWRMAVAILILLSNPIKAPALESDPKLKEPAALVPTFCFAPGTSEETVEQTLLRFNHSLLMHSLSLQTPQKYELSYRWSYTATNGGGLGQGDPTSLTWSIVPDGTSITPAYPGESSAGSGLRSFLNGIYGNQATWLAIFQQVFDRWSELTGITYVYEPNDDGGAMPGSGGILGVRGDIRIGGHAIDGNSNVLAYNYYPNTGDMVIDSPDSYFSNTSSNSIRLRNMLAHEHGHGLGLDHVCPINQTKLMEPYLTTSFDGPQHDDILATNRLYGDSHEHNENPGTAAILGSFESTNLENISIDDNSDTDFYRFSVGDAAAIDVTVTPIGSTYFSGAQVGGCTTGTSFDSLRIHDLSVRILDSDGSTELDSANLNGVGLPEVLTDVALSSGAGTYYVEISGDSTNSAQMYELALSISSTPGIFSDGFEIGNPSQWSSTAP